MLALLVMFFAFALALALVVVVAVVGDLNGYRRSLLDTAHAWSLAEAREQRRAADRALRIALGQPEGEPRPDGSAVLAYWRA